MAISLERDVIVGPGGRIELQVPELQAGQRVRVTIEPAEHKRGLRAIDVLEELSGHRLFKTAEDVDTYVRAERGSWQE
jgi:hypothetical protein